VQQETACNPTLNSTAGFCLEGYADRLCSRCLDGFFNNGRLCERCSPLMTWLIPVAGFALVAAVVIYSLTVRSSFVNCAQKHELTVP